MRPGLFKRSARASANLSPTQLYSERLEVFSNGNTITTSAAGFCADAFRGREITAKSRKKAENRRKLKLQTPPKETQRANCSRKLHVGLHRDYMEYETRISSSGPRD